MSIRARYGEYIPRTRDSLFATVGMNSHSDMLIYRVAQKTEHSIFFLGLCSDQHLSFYTLLDRASFPHYNNTKIIKFGWELFISWVISHGLSYSGFAISLSLIVPLNSGNQANPENDSP